MVARYINKYVYRICDGRKVYKQVCLSYMRWSQGIQTSMFTVYAMVARYINKYVYRICGEDSLKVYIYVYHNHILSFLILIFL